MLAHPIDALIHRSVGLVLRRTMMLAHNDMADESGPLIGVLRRTMTLAHSTSRCRYRSMTDVLRRTMMLAHGIMKKQAGNYVRQGGN